MRSLSQEKGRRILRPVGASCLPGGRSVACLWSVTDLPSGRNITVMPHASSVIGGAPHASMNIFVGSLDDLEGKKESA